MKVLLAVVNCHSRLAYQQCIRDTWMPLVQGADVRFFLGPSTREPQTDEVFVECDDSYQGLPSKIKAIAQWALEHGYSQMLKCDDDVVMVPHKVLSSGFQNHEFSGHRNDIRAYSVPYGFCYWLGKRAMQLVADAELPRDNNDEVWVTHALSKENIVLHHDSRYQIHTGKREDFVQKVRSLRSPRRDAPFVDPTLEVFAKVMYIPWMGYKNLPDEQNIAEMKRVFKEMQ